MRILHFAFIYNDEFNYQENELPKAHAYLGHQVTVISTQDFAGAINKYQYRQPISNCAPYYIDNVKIIRLPLKFKINYRFSLLKNLYNTIEDEKPNLIFSHGAAILNFRIIRNYIKEHPSCYWCMDFHSDYYNTGTNFISRFYHKYFFRFIIKSVIKYVNIAYYITPLVREFVENIYKLPQNKLKMLPLGFDTSQIDLNQKDKHRKSIRSELNISVDDVVIISGGRIDSEKKTIELIEAFKKLNKKNIHLIIFGKIVDEYKERVILTIDQHPFIHLIGWLNSRDINNYFLAADIACFPGSQSVLWQHAIGCGLPICIKYFHGIEYLDLGGNVRYLVNSNAESIKIALKEIIENRALMDSMARIAIQKGRDYFSYLNIANSIINDLKAI